MLRPFARLALLSAPALLLLAPQLAHAHAVLVASTPKQNDSVQGPALDVDLKFNSRVDGVRSILQLASADGTVKALKLGAQPSPNEVISHIDGLTRGSYTLRWQALASDGHISRGQIPFEVK